MYGRLMNRVTALLMIFIILFWNMFPLISYAGGFITPGKAITPGDALTPGVPIQGGKFIIPGEVYEPGKSGSNGSYGHSGQPILPSSPLKLGTFIIPNSPLIPSSNGSWKLVGIQAGIALQSGVASQNGNGLKGGTDISGGQAANGGTGLSGGQAANGGTGLSGGKAVNGGTGLSGGQAVNGGTGLSGGQAANGGTGLSGGQAANGGTGLNGGQAANGGTELNGGKAASGGTGLNGGKAANGGNSNSDNSQPSSLNSIFKSTDGSKGIFGHFFGSLDDFKTYGFGFLNQKVGGALVSLNAGFNIEKILGSDNYSVSGRNKFNNKFLDYLYNNHKSYDKNGSPRSLGVNTSEIRENTYNDFLRSKGLRLTNQSKLDYIKASLKNELSEGWMPFTRDFSNIKRLSFLNKGFFKSSSKLAGPLNYVIAGAGSFYDYKYGANKKYGLNSTEFASDLTVEVGLTAGTVIVSSIASGAVMGAVGGPLGIIFGAGIGLVIGVGSNLLLNTKFGNKFKDKLKAGVNYIYKGISQGWRKLGGLFGG